MPPSQPEPIPARASYACAFRPPAYHERTHRAGMRQLTPPLGDQPPSPPSAAPAIPARSETRRWASGGRVDDVEGHQIAVEVDRQSAQVPHRRDTADRKSGHITDDLGARLL